MVPSRRAMSLSSSRTPGAVHQQEYRREGIAALGTADEGLHRAVGGDNVHSFLNHWNISAYRLNWHDLACLIAVAQAGTPGAPVGTRQVCWRWRNRFLGSVWAFW